MPAKCLTFLFIRLTDSVQEIKTAGRERERDNEKRDSGRETDNGSRSVKQRGGESEIGPEKERAVIWSCFGSPLWLGSHLVSTTLLPMWANMCHCVPTWAGACCPGQSFEKKVGLGFDTLMFKGLWNAIWLGGDMEEKSKTERGRRREDYVLKLPACQWAWPLCEAKVVVWSSRHPQPLSKRP